MFNTSTSNLVKVLFLMVLKAYVGYTIKTKMNINIFPGGHTPQILEERTVGIIQCEWFPGRRGCR